MTNKEIYEQKAAAYVKNAMAVAEAKAVYWRSKADSIVEQARAAAEIKAELWNQKAESSVTCKQAVLWATKADAAVKLAVQLAEVQATAFRAKADAFLTRARAVAEAQAASYWPAPAEPAASAPPTEDVQYEAFKELLIDTLGEYFSSNPTAPEWRGTASRAIMLLHMNAKHESIVRLIRLERASAFLARVEQEGAISCHSELGALKTLVWIFPRQ